MNDLTLTILLLIAGIGTGLATGIARVPRVRVIPGAAAATLAVLLALVVLMTRPAELWLGLSLAALIIVSAPLSGAWMWKHEVGVDAGYGWLLAQEFFHPQHLRRWHEEAATGRGRRAASGRTRARGR